MTDNERALYDRGLLPRFEAFVRFAHHHDDRSAFQLAAIWNANHPGCPVTGAEVIAAWRTWRVTFSKKWYQEYFRRWELVSRPAELDDEDRR